MKALLIVGLSWALLLSARPGRDESSNVWASQWPLLGFNSSRHASNVSCRHDRWMETSRRYGRGCQR